MYRKKHLMDRITLRVGICDDKKEDMDRITEALQKSVKKIGLQCRITCSRYTDGEKMYQDSRENPFQLIFLDIEMPGLDGFRLADRLCIERPTTYLVFVSAHESFVFDAPEYMPLWFVRKSRLEWDMFRAVRKYFEVTAVARVSYRMKEGFGYQEVPISDILYMESNGHNLTIHKTDGSRLVKYGSLKAIEKELEGYGFLRIHKSYLVNQKYIKEVARQEIYLTDGSCVDMGRDRKNSVRKAMLQYEKEHYGI